MLESFQTTKEERKKLPLILRIIGINHNQEDINRPNGIAIHQWFYCSKGQGQLTVNGQRFAITPGSAFFIRAGDAHKYSGSNMILHILGFEGSICSSLFKTLGIGESGVYHMSEPEYFCSQLNSLYLASTRNIHHKKYYYSESLYSILLNLSLHISRIINYEAEQNNPTVSAIISYLEENYSKNVSLTDLSEALDKTPEYLCALFKENLHLTIIEELTNIRISHARSMLIESPEKNASEIGYLCGFQSPSYFGKVFKKKCGASPAEYRQKKS